MATPEEIAGRLKDIGEPVYNERDNSVLLRDADPGEFVRWLMSQRYEAIMVKVQARALSCTVEGVKVRLVVP